MTDYANDDVDKLRLAAEYCGGTEHGVFLARLADRMEEVVSDVARPVFTRLDVELMRALGTMEGPDWRPYNNLGDRIEQALPTEAKA